MVELKPSSFFHMIEPRCPLCDGRDFVEAAVVEGPDDYLDLLSISYSDLDRRWLRCSACGHLSNSVRLDEGEISSLYSLFRDVAFRNETPDNYFNRITSLPAAQSENYQKLEYLASKTAIQSAVTRTMLDIGCGGGVLIHTASQILGSDWVFSGVEPTVSFAELAARRTGARVVAGDYRSGIFGEEKFQLVTCCAVLEHVPRPTEFLGMIRNDVINGGWLFLEVPDVSEFSQLPITHDHFMCQHISFFSRKTLVAILETVGFDCADVTVVRTLRGHCTLRCIAQAT